jgi:putative addiction module component (TIGR02574 family)
MAILHATGRRSALGLWWWFLHFHILVFLQSARTLPNLPAGNILRFEYRAPMSQVTALLKEASKLALPDRVELVSSLLEDLDPEPHSVSDEEVMERLEELKSGKVQGLSTEEFWKACGRQ